MGKCRGRTGQGTGGGALASYVGRSRRRDAALRPALDDLREGSDGGPAKDQGVQDSGIFVWAESLEGT